MFQHLLTLLSRSRSETRTENLLVDLSNLVRNCKSGGPFPHVYSNFHQRIDSLRIETSSDEAGSMETDEVDSDVKWTPLAIAVQNNKIDDVRKLLLLGAELDALLPAGRTALLLAAELCLEEICKMLLLANANPNSIDPRGYTALHFAVESSQSSPSLQFISVLCMMVNVNAMTNEGKTALNLAVGKNRYDVAKVLIIKGAITTLLDNLGRTLLHVAAENGNLQIFQLQLEEVHLKKMALTASLDTVMMPIHIAAKKGHAEFVRYLVNKNLYTAIAKDKEGRSALHLATAERHWDVVNILLDNNWDIEDSMSVTSRKCLHLVAANGSVEGVELFLRRGANPDVLDNQLWTPLHYAVSGNHLYVVRVLLQANANTTLKNLQDMTPAMLAHRDNSSKEIADIFSNGYADQEEAAGSAMMDTLDTTEVNVDWGDLQTRQRKRYLVHNHLENLKLNLALHRYFTFPADYDTRSGLKRIDLAHSGFFFPADYQSLQCYYCTYEIKTLEGWKGLDLDALNQKHAEESRINFG
jgi:ankyrin repeat protein